MGRRQSKHIASPIRKRIYSAPMPPTQTTVPLTWQVREYVEDDGAAHEPVLADFFRVSTTDYHVYSRRGHISDGNHAQYQHKLYTVYLLAEQDTVIPMEIFWLEQLQIISVFDGVETEVHTTGTDDNTVSRLDIELSRGLNVLNILTYTGVANQRLEMTLDVASILSATPIGRITPGFFQAVLAVPDDLQAEADDWPLLTVHSDWAPNGITILSLGIWTSESSTYSVTFQSQTSPTDGSPVTLETVSTSASLIAEDDGTLTVDQVAAGSGVFVDLPTDDISWVHVWGTYMVNG